MLKYALTGMSVFAVVCHTALAQPRDRSHCIDVDDDGIYANVDTYCATPGFVDCDDNDPTRFWGNAESLDPLNKDNDCDPMTTGLVASDFPGGQLCDGENVVVLKEEKLGFIYSIQPLRGVYLEGRARSNVSSYTTTAATCGPSLVCIPQPNGAGVCGVKPAAYKTPARFVYVTPQRMSVAGQVDKAVTTLPDVPILKDVPTLIPSKPLKN